VDHSVPRWKVDDERKKSKALDSQRHILYSLQPVDPHRPDKLALIAQRLWSQGQPSGFPEAFSG
jgi:hypothetical protein